MKKFWHILLLVLLSIIIVASFYINLNFANEPAEEMLFYLSNGAKKGSIDVYLVGIRKCALYIILLVGILYVSFYPVTKKDINIKIKKKSFKIYPFNFVIKHSKIITLIISILFITVSLYNFKVFDTVKNTVVSSTFIEDNYEFISKEDITFPKKKNNLIFIVAESLETTFFTKNQGGDWDYEVIPELYDLLYDDGAVFFGATKKASGMQSLSGTSWTTAALVAMNTGLPFKVPVGYNNRYKSHNFMASAYSLGDILLDNGYYNELISASKTSFGGLKEFYTKHGNYNIVDIKSLDKYGFKMEKKDKSSWGFNDNFMFEIAKERLNEVSKKEEPFNMTIIGIDAHPTDGYIGDYSLDKYDDRYENVYATESKLIGDFVNWVKEQDYYKDTTIVITGDHLNMQTEYFKGKNVSLRNKYNVIINSQAKSDNTKERIFTSLDMYPTIVSALGATIKDDKLGLGINLFSDKKTLAEEYGLKYLNKELEKNSLFYNHKILGSNDYYKMVLD